MSSMWTREQLDAWHRDGFLVVSGLLDAEELQAIRKALSEDESVVAHAFELSDGQGRKSKLSLWNHPGSDVTGLIARADKVVNRVEELLGGEVYHYHTKLIMKEAHTGGSFLWHQDYGYWYQNGFLYPDFATAFIALDPSTRANGCLQVASLLMPLFCIAIEVELTAAIAHADHQVLRGSHRMGRIEHTRIGGQTAADPARVAEAAKVQELVHVELQPGDTLFFHGNLLHKSDQNHSSTPRYAFLVAYNKADNVSNKPHHHPLYTKLDKVRDSEIKLCTSSEMKGKDFMDPSTDETIKAHDYH